MEKSHQNHAASLYSQQANIALVITLTMANMWSTSPLYAARSSKSAAQDSRASYSHLASRQRWLSRAHNRLERACSNSAFAIRLSRTRHAAMPPAAHAPGGIVRQFLEWC